MGKGIGGSGYRGVRKFYTLWRAVLPDETVLGLYGTPLEAAIVRERFIHEHRDEFINPERYLNGVDLAPGVTIESYKTPKEYVYQDTRSKRYFVRIGKHTSPRFIEKSQAIAHRDEYLKNVCR
ncbi:hypothetical protein [Dolichospermum phage Dfl-JY23]